MVHASINRPMLGKLKVPLVMAILSIFWRVPYCYMYILESTGVAQKRLFFCIQSLKSANDRLSIHDFG